MKILVVNLGFIYRNDTTIRCTTEIAHLGNNFWTYKQQSSHFCSWSHDRNGFHSSIKCICDKKKKSNFTHFSICVPIIVTPPENRLYGSILKILLLIDFLKKHQKNNLFCHTYSFTFIFIIRAIFHFPIESLTM